MRLCFSVAEQTDRTYAEQQESRWLGDLLEGKVIHRQSTSLSNDTHLIDLACITRCEKSRAAWAAARAGETRFKILDVPTSVAPL